MANNSQPNRGTWTRHPNKISADAIRFVAADAIAIESVSSPGNQVTWILPVTVPDAYDVYARWGSSNNGASDAKYTITHAGAPTR